MTNTKQTKIDKPKADTNQTPVLTLNTTDKVYLALVRKDVDTYNYVYALVLNNENMGKNANPSYPMVPVTEISAFATAKQADIYFHTANRVMEYQKTMLKDFYNMAFEFSKDLIAKFNAEFDSKSR